MRGVDMRSVGCKRRVKRGGAIIERKGCEGRVKRGGANEQATLSIDVGELSEKPCRNECKKDLPRDYRCIDTCPRSSGRCSSGQSANWREVASEQKNTSLQPGQGKKKRTSIIASKCEQATEEYNAHAERRFECRAQGSMSDHGDSLQRSCTSIRKHASCITWALKCPKAAVGQWER